MKGPPNCARSSAGRAAATSELNQFNLESVLRSSSHISSELVCSPDARAAVRGTKQVRRRPILHPNAEKAQTPASPAVVEARGAVLGGQWDLVVLDLAAGGLGRFGPRCRRWGDLVVLDPAAAAGGTWRWGTSPLFYSGGSDPADACQLIGLHC